MLSQTSLPQISMYIQTFIPVKVSFFSKGNRQSIQQFSYCSKTSKETNQILSLSNCNWTRPHNHLVRKRALNHSVKLAK